jgi:hypothetical protein
MATLRFAQLDLALLHAERAPARFSRTSTREGILSQIRLKQPCLRLYPKLYEQLCGEKSCKRMYRDVTRAEPEEHASSSQGVSQPVRG